MLNRILAAAVVAGALAGVAITGLHMVWAVPLIVQAEAYEAAGAEAQPAGHVHAGHTHAAEAMHEHAAPAAHDHGGHVHEAPAATSDGMRSLKTLISNIVVGVAGALIMAALFALLEGVNWRLGLAYGAAAFAAFGLAPSLGLPPELPGTQAAELGARQLWWAGTAIATLAGLAAVVYGPKTWLKALGAALVALPHLIGAPQPAIHGALAPADLQHQFVIASVTVSAVFWVLLGGLTGFFAQRFHATGREPQPTAV